jgi:hypothetical protein
MMNHVVPREDKLISGRFKQKLSRVTVSHNARQTTIPRTPVTYYKYNTVDTAVETQNFMQKKKSSAKCPMVHPMINPHQATFPEDSTLLLH